MVVLFQASLVRAREILVYRDHAEFTHVYVPAKRAHRTNHNTTIAWDAFFLLRIRNVCLHKLPIRLYPELNVPPLPLKYMEQYQCYCYEVNSRRQRCCRRIRYFLFCCNGRYIVYPEVCFREVQVFLGSFLNIEDDIVLVTVIVLWPLSTYAGGIPVGYTTKPWWVGCVRHICFRPYNEYDVNIHNKYKYIHEYNVNILFVFKTPQWNILRNYKKLTVRSLHDCL